ncbi:lipoprotein [Pseudomonas peli]|nr:lipoprotein [Pseudomonas peli]NMZ71327.1 lipoprotein [Pseudomonas peli]NMZ71383.1 lipoprotein [Pseudomonas peli]
MNKFLILAVAVLLVTGCSTKPPTPPEPEGPLVKVNVNQPHETFGGAAK